jgi:hypothetical protein
MSLGETSTSAAPALRAIVHAIANSNVDAGFIVSRNTRCT